MPALPIISTQRFKSHSVFDDLSKNEFKLEIMIILEAKVGQKREKLVQREETIHDLVETLICKRMHFIRRERARDRCLLGRLPVSLPEF